MAIALAAALHLLLPLHCKLLRISRSLRTQRMKLVQLTVHTHHVTNHLPTCCAYKVWKKKFFEDEQSGKRDDDDHHQYLAAHICSMKIPSTKSCNSKSEIMESIHHPSLQFTRDFLIHQQQSFRGKLLQINTRRQFMEFSDTCRKSMELFINTCSKS
jgi:hypothetical protein